MDYRNQQYRHKNVLQDRTERERNRNKENIMNNEHHQINMKMNKMKQLPLDEYEKLIKELNKLKQDINLSSKVKSELLQVSKKETEEYANNIDEYSKAFESMNQEIEILKQEKNQYQQDIHNQKEQIQTLAMAMEEKHAQNQRKEQEIHKLQQQNMSMQHEKVLLQQKLQSVRENFFNDDNLMNVLCQKLELETCRNFNGLVNFVSNAKRLNIEYTQIKQELHDKSEEIERYKIELISHKKQIEVFEDNKNFEKGQLIHVESLRLENENLRKEIRILEESNAKLSNDLIERSEKRMDLMNENLFKMQQQHNKVINDYEKKLEKFRREKKAYQHKCEHWKKETKGFSQKYEDLTRKFEELQQQNAIYQRNDDNISDDYERRMGELEANNDALNEQLQQTRHEMEELNLLKDNLTKNNINFEKQVASLNNELKIKQHEYTTLNNEYQQALNQLNQLKASKALMEKMWNEFKHNQNEQNELLINNLESKLSKMQQEEVYKLNHQIQIYQQEINTLKQKLQINIKHKQQNETIAELQHENDRLNKQISELNRQINVLQQFNHNNNRSNKKEDDDHIDNPLTHSHNSSLMLINNNDTLKQRSMELKKENIRLHQELVQTKRSLENRGWEATLTQQNLKSDIQNLQLKLCHNESKLKDKTHEIEQLNKLLSSTEVKLEEIRNKNESLGQLNARSETQITNLQLYISSLKTNIQEHKDEIKALKARMDSLYDRYNHHDTQQQQHREMMFDGNKHESELVNTLKIQNNELRQKFESSQENILSLREEISSLRQTNNALSDRYDSNTKITQSRDSQIQQLRNELSSTQTRESKLMQKLSETKISLEKFKVESQQFQIQIIDLKQYNEKLTQQLNFFHNKRENVKYDNYEQFSKLTNKLEIVTRNAETLKLTNNKMHEQIEYLKKEYEDLHNELSKKEEQLHGLNEKHSKYAVLKQQYNKLQDDHTVISKKYEILKQHWDGLNKDRSVAIEKLKTEAQRVSESEKKLSKLQIAIAELNHERSKLEKEKQSTTNHMNQMHEKLKKLKNELKNKQIELENVDEEKLKWKARTDRLKQETQKVSNAVIMNEVKVQEEIQLLKSENSNLKQEIEKKLYDIEDLQSKNTQITEKLNEWKLKYDEMNEKYEFESGQHDNTLKKLNDIRSIWDGETNLKQLLQIKQQNIQELQSKINELEKVQINYNKLLKENDRLKFENDRIQKRIEEHTNVQSSLKTRINVQRNIINEQEQEQQQLYDINNTISITNDEYQQIQQQLNTLTELQNKYDLAQQQIIELENELSKWQNIKTDLDTSELIPSSIINNNNNNNNNHGINNDKLQELVALLHKKDQSLHDLQDEYEQIKTENSALISNIHQLEQNKITIQHSLKQNQKKLKDTEESLITSQTKIHAIEGQRDSLAKKLRTLSSKNAKLQIELYSLSSAADLVQEQLKTSAVALSSTTDKKQKLIQEIENLQENLKSAEQHIVDLQNENSNLQIMNNKLLNQFNTLKFTHQQLKQSHHANDNIYEDQSELLQNTMQNVQMQRQKLQTFQKNAQKEVEQLQDKYNAAKTESVEMITKAQLISKQFESLKSQHDRLKTESFELKRVIKQLENNKNSMMMEKQELQKQINKLQTRYCSLFNEHNDLMQKFNATSHELSEMKLSKQSAFIERDLLDYKIEQLQGDNSNAVHQLNNLRSSYYEQSKKFKSEHNELYNKYKEISAEREELKIQSEQLLNEKQTLENMVNALQNQLQNNNENKDSQYMQIQDKYDELLSKNAELASKLTAVNTENKELRVNYGKVTDKLTNAQLQIDELNIICNESKTDNQYTKDMIANMKDKLLAKDDQYQQLQINYHDQENKLIKFNHDLQTLLQSYNNIAAENEQLHSENQTLYQQLQIEQIDKYVQNTKAPQTNINDQPTTATFNSHIINLQSLVKKGRVLTEQCADLNAENTVLKTKNQGLTQQVSDLQEQISLLVVKNENNENKDNVNDVNDDDIQLPQVTVNGADNTNGNAVMLLHNKEAMEDDADTLIMSNPHHEAVLRELRHRNEQLMNQVRSLQLDLETDTELIDRLQKENGELRTKLRTLLQRQNEETPSPKKIVAVDGKGEPWQDIIKGLRKQLQEARREIAELCEESMGKTQHINDVESENMNLLKNIHVLEQDNKQLTESLAASPKPEDNDNTTNDKNSDGQQLAKEYSRNEELCDHMQEMIQRLMTEQQTKEELANKFKQLQDNLIKTKTQLIEFENAKNKAQKRNNIIEHELSLLKRAKAQLSDHNEQLATEITKLQSIKFEQQQKLSSQQQEISELQALYQNIQSQLEIKNSLNEQLQNERQSIIQLFAVTEIIPDHPVDTVDEIKNKFIDLGFDEPESKMESDEPSIMDFDKVQFDKNQFDKFETLDLKHEIECLLSNYQRIIEKNEELQRNVEHNERENTLQNDFNAKFEEIKALLIEQQNNNNVFLSTPTANRANMDHNNTNNTNNGSAKFTNNTSDDHKVNSGNGPRLSLSENISPFRNSFGLCNELNMTNPDLLNTSMQHMEEIMNTHKMMKEEEFEQLLNTKKELLNELDVLQTKYNTVSRENANQSQKLSLMEQKNKHISNQLENVTAERDSLRSEMNNNKELIDKLSKDFKSIGQERDHLYQKVKSLQQELDEKLKSDQTEFDKNEQEYHRLRQEINELNDLNLKQSNQIDLLQSHNNNIQQQYKESQHRYNSITNDFKTMKSKYENLNEEYDNLSTQQQKLYYEMNEIKQINDQKSIQIRSLENRLNAAMDECQKFEQNVSKNKLKYENEISDYQSRITELQLLLDSTKFEMVAQQSSDSNKHIQDLNDQLELLKTKYENRLQSTKKQYSDKIAKMNEAVTKLSSARTKLQNEIAHLKNQLIDQEEKSNVEIDYLKDQLNKIVIDKQNVEKKVGELQTELETAEKHNQLLSKKNNELDDKQTKLLQDCNRRIESALKHKTSVDQELVQLQELHNNKIQGLDTRFEDLLNKYQQSVQENEIIKVAKEQHEMLVKQIDHLHSQLKQSRQEHQQLRQKAQLHYTRRKEEWKKLKQFENNVNKKDEQINELNRKQAHYIKQIGELKKEIQQKSNTLSSINQTELNSLCKSVDDMIWKIKHIFNDDDMDDINAMNHKSYSLSNLCEFLRNALVSLTSLCTTSQIMIKQFDKANNENDSKYKEQMMEMRQQLIDLTKENEKLRFNELNIKSEIDEYKTKLITTKKHIEETDKLMETERLNWRKQLKNNNIEFQELSDKVKLIEQQNNNLRSQIIQLNHDIQELETENNNLREERRRSLEGNTNNEFLTEKINLQRQLRALREERDIAEKKLKENETKYKQISLQIHQLKLQFESSQQRVNNLENENMKMKQQLNANNELLSSLEAEKTALSKKNNELYDGNVSLEEKHRKSQQEIGKFQVKSDRLRQQRDYAKSKYKELKAKFNSLEQQFRNLQSRYNNNHHNNSNGRNSNNNNDSNHNQNPQTSQTLPF